MSFQLNFKLRGIPNYKHGIRVNVLLDTGYPYAQNYVLLGQTEASSGSSIDFKTTVPIDYTFDQYQHLHFDITKADESSLIARIDTSLGDIIGSKGLSASYGFRAESPQQCALLVVARRPPIQGVSGEVKLQFSAKKLDRKDFLGKSDPYFKIVRHENDQFIPVYQSEHITQTLDPKWKSFKIPINKLTVSGKTDEFFYIHCFDWDKVGSHDFIGECKVSLDMLKKEDTFYFINPKKSRKAKYKHSGKLIVEKCKIDDVSQFSDYIVGGLNLNVLVAIDFSDNAKNICHWDNPSQNEYLQAIKAIVSLLESYDSDKKIPLYGFGGTFHGNALPCYPLNGNPSDPEVIGLGGVLSTYTNSLPSIKLHGQPSLTPIVQKATDIAKYVQAHQSTQQGYLVCALFTQGSVQDIASTMKLIAESSVLPVSFVIVSLGPTNDLDKLKKKVEIKLNNTTFKRESVQVISLQKYQGKLQDLTKKVLKQIPVDVVNYMKAFNIQANKYTEQDIVVIEEQRFTVALNGGSSVVPYQPFF